jgi:hypothetical protein
MRANLYLDIDGVLIIDTDESPFERVELNAIEKYAPEVATRLGQTGMNIVWVSTWGRQASHLSERIEAFREARILPLLPREVNPNKTTRKMLTIIGEQEVAPTPFAWVDDDITEDERRTIDRRISVPKLLIKPDKRVGLTDEHLQQIEVFAEEHAVSS